MPKITAIKQQKRKDRFNLYVDEKFALGLSAEVLGKAGLRIGQKISEKEIKKLSNQDTKGKLYNRALRFLSYRPRSEREVRDYLNKKIAALRAQRKGKVALATDYTEVLEGVIRRLKSQNLINDQEFAWWWFEQRQAFRPKGARAIKQELRQKGVSDSLITQLLNDFLTPETEQQTARSLAKRRQKQLRGLSSLELRQKLTRFLAHRGFSYETIKLALDEIFRKG